jgi:apolipoprotein D and lipocalin family protein
LLSCASTSAKLSPPIEGNFHLEKYLGTWYEIARLPNWFEKNLINVTASYEPHNKNSISVINKGYDYQKNKWKEAKGRAKFAQNSKIGHLRVSFFRPFYADYFVLEVDENYEYALVGGSSPNYLWILAREKKLAKQITDRLLLKAEKLGYRVENAEFIKQE